MAVVKYRAVHVSPKSLIRYVMNGNKIDVQYLCTTPDIDGHTRSRLIFNESRHSLMWNIVKGFRFGGKVNISDNKYFILNSVNDIVRFQFYENPKLFDLSGEKRIKAAADDVLGDLNDFIDAVRDSDGSLVIITTEAAMLKEHENISDDCRLALAIVNERVSSLVDEVFFSASGVQFKIK